MKISYLVWFLLLSVVSWQDFQKQEISSWLLILMGSLGTGIQIFEGSVSLGAWFGGILLGAALLFLAFVTREEIGYGDGWLVLVMGTEILFSVFPSCIRDLSPGGRLSSDLPESAEKLPAALCSVSSGRFGAEPGSVWRMKMKKGSYTVEAALLMGILIPLLTGVIYLGFFMELRGQVQAEAMEKALTGLLTEEEAEGVSLGKKEISAETEAEVPVFPFGKRIFSLPDSVSGKFVLERQKPVRTIFRMHSMKKAIRQVKKE